MGRISLAISTAVILFLSGVAPPDLDPDLLGEIELGDRMFASPGVFGLLDDDDLILVQVLGDDKGCRQGGVELRRGVAQPAQARGVEIGHGPSEVRVLDQDTGLGVQVRRASVEVEGSDEHDLAVEDRGLGVNTQVRDWLAGGEAVRHLGL